MITTMAWFVLSILMISGVILLVMAFACPQRLFPPTLFGWKRRTEPTEMELALTELQKAGIEMGAAVADALQPVVEAMNDVGLAMGKYLNRRRHDEG